MIFRPLVKFNVTITLGSSRSHKKALAIARIATFLDSVVELEIGEKPRYLFQFQYLFSSTLFTLLRALPAMRQLHTMHLSSIFLLETDLYCILSSPHLTHLRLYAIQMPKMSRFPPPNPNLRKLTLMSMVSWDVRPLLVHLAASLEYLELRSAKPNFWYRSQLQLPFFPSLRELHHLQYDYGNEAMLDELFQVSQVTHLHLSGTFNSSRIAAFPKSLQHLSTEHEMLSQQTLGTTPMAQLISLSIRVSVYWDMIRPLPTLSAFVGDHFPGVTSLHLDIPWSLLNVALVVARSQHNVRAVELSISIDGRPDSEGEWDLCHVRTYHRNNMLPGVLQSLRLDVFQDYGELEPSLAQLTRWIDDDVVHPVTGLGGSDLKSIDVSFILHKRGLGRERRIWKRWAKLSDGVWRIEGAL